MRFASILCLPPDTELLHQSARDFFEEALSI